MLWKRTEENRIDLQTIVDLEVYKDSVFDAVIFQAVHFGCPLVDIAKILTCLLSTEVRREHWKCLVEYWMYCMGEEIAYTLEQVTSSSVA